MARSERSKMLDEYLAALNDAKLAAENLGWRGDVAKINGMISAASTACADAHRPELTMLSVNGPLSSWLLGPI